jgi:hypothetical protein
LEQGGNILKSFKQFLGSMLVSLGEAIIRMSFTLLAAAFMQGMIQGGLPGAIAYSAAALPWVGIGVAAGTGLIILGQALGGTGSYTQTANTNTSNATNAATGATGNNFNPSTDPKTIYQKAMATQVYIDVRTDDGVIVRKIIKAVNENGRLSNLIGNRHLGFSV